MQRILQLDFFRGFFLVIITVNHFISNNNIIKKFTSNFIGWISAAEGFVFLSGFTIGLIYTYYYHKKGGQYVIMASRNRAWTIYKNHLALLFLSIGLLLAMNNFGTYLGPEYNTIIQKPAIATILGSALLYQPPLLDILPMYALFMLLVPLAIKAFNQRQHWPVLLASFFVYLVGTFNLIEPLITDKGWGKYVFMGIFNPLCWQFLFVVGVFIGVKFKQGKVHAIKQQKKLFLGAAAISIAFFLFNQLQISLPGFDLVYWIDKDHIRPLRLLNFASLTFLMTFIVFRYKEKFKFQPFSYLGKYSLQVFVWHIPLVLLLRPFRTFLNDLVSVQVFSYYIYPLETLLLIILLAALFLAPTLLNKGNFKNLTSSATR